LEPAEGDISVAKLWHWHISEEKRGWLSGGGHPIHCTATSEDGKFGSGNPAADDVEQHKSIAIAIAQLKNRIKRFPLFTVAATCKMGKALLQRPLITDSRHGPIHEFGRRDSNDEMCTANKDA
jgi:hypothetical protein